VSNGLEAVSYLSSNECDLILMDIQMPQMDGYAATQKIREELKLNIPIIAMTAHALPGEREKCLSRGMNEYIPKPVKEEELFTLISKLGLKENNRSEKKTEDTPSDYQYINLTYMNTVSGGDKSFEKLVTQQFIENIPNHLQQLVTAYKNHDFAAMKLWSHDLKSSISIMGLHPLLKEKLDILETASAEDPELQKILTEVQEVLLQAVSEAESFSKSLKKN
jgi:CheY-like chemotaxis protein